MRNTIYLSIIIILLASAFVLADTYVDTINSEFEQGNHNNTVNVSNQVYLGLKNHINNPSFETASLSGWTSSPTEGVNDSTTISIDGSRSAFFNHTSQTTTSITQPLTLIANKEYTVSYYYNMTYTTGTGFYCYVDEFTDATGVTTATAATSDVSWNVANFTFTTGSDTSGSIICILSSATAIVYLDNVMLESGDTNSTFTETGYSNYGTFISRAFDLGSFPNVSISWNELSSAPTTYLDIRTRISRDNSTYDDWSSNLTSGVVAFPKGYRYVQYMALLSTSDTSQTPSLLDLSFTYTQNGPYVNKSGATENLTSAHNDTYNFFVDFEEISGVTISEAIGSYRFGSDGWSPVSNLTSYNSTTYYYQIPEPSGHGWAAKANTNLSIQINLTNSNSKTNTSIFTEYVDESDTPPYWFNVSNQTILVGELLNITADFAEYNGRDVALYTDIGEATITKENATQARIIWRPSSGYIGNNTMMLNAVEVIGSVNGSISFNVEVIGNNTAPQITHITNVTSYFGVPAIFYMTAYDAETDTLYANVSGNLLTLLLSQNTTFTYNVTVNFTPLQQHVGYRNITVTLNDSIDTTSANFTLNVTYCGDNWCESSYEDYDSCPTDCSFTMDDPVGIYLVIPPRICLNQNTTIVAYNTSETREGCYIDIGLVDQEYSSLCEALDGVSISVQRIVSNIYQELATFNTNTTGGGTYVFEEEGQYKLVSTKDGYPLDRRFLHVRDCDEFTIDTGDQVHDVDVETPPPEESPSPVTQEPEEDAPLNLFEEPTSRKAWWVYLIYWFVIPILLAALVYTGNVFYQKNKNDVVFLLEMRIWFLQQKIKYKPHIVKALKPLMPFWKKIEPYIKSVIGVLANYFKYLKEFYNDIEGFIINIILKTQKIKEPPKYEQQSEQQQQMQQQNPQQYPQNQQQQYTPEQQQQMQQQNPPQQ